MSSKFKAGSYDWEIRLTVGGIAAVRDEAKVNLADAFTDQTTLVARLCNDPVLLVETLFVLTKKQREERQNIDREEFMDYFSGECIAAARAALFAEIANFCDDPRRKRTWRLTVETHEKVHALEHDAIPARLEAGLSRVEQMFSGTAGDSQESSDSPVPTTTPSAS